MATRLRPLTNDTPKCLLEINGIPLLKRSMDAIVAAGIRDFVIVTGFRKEKTERFVCQTYGDAISRSYTTPSTKRQTTSTRYGSHSLKLRAETYCCSTATCSTTPESYAM